MPTGYTAGVGDGKITTFRDFALLCARAFGATITMRDGPFDKQIPDEFKPSTEFHDRAIERDTLERARIAALSPDACDAAAAEEHAAEVRRDAAIRASHERVRTRYESMLAAVRAWTPPTDEHVEMQLFMVEQLTESIRFDCSYKVTPPARMTGEEWRARALANIERSLAYHQQARADEIDRTAKRNAWIKALRDSLSTHQEPA